MKNKNIIILAVAAGLGYYFYSQNQKRKEDNSKKIVDDNTTSLPIVTVDKPPARKEVAAPQKLNAFTQLNAFTYDKKKTIEPVAKTLDTIKNAIFVQPIKPFTLNPAGQPAVQNAATKQKAAKKQKAKKAKLGILGATYLYV